MKRFLALLLLSFFIGSLWAAKNYEDPKVGELLEKMIQTTGGQEKWSKLKSLKTESTAEMLGMGMKMKITTISASNKAKLMTEMNGQMMAEQGFDGKVTWSKDMMMGLRELKGPEAMAIQQATLEHTLDATGFFDKIKLGEDREFKGEKVHVLLCDKEGMDTSELYISAKDYQLKGMMTVQVTIQGKMKTEIACDAYKTSESGLLYLSESTIDMGPIKMKLTVDAYQENVEVDEVMFKMPKSK